MKYAQLDLTKAEKAALSRGQTDVLRDWFEAVLRGLTPPYAVLYSWSATFREEWSENRDVRDAFEGHLTAQADRGEDTEESERRIRRLFVAADARDLIRIPKLAGGRWLALPISRDDQSDDEYFRAFLLACFADWLALVSPQSKSGRIRVARCDSCGGVFVDGTRQRSARFCGVNCRTKWHRHHASETTKEKARQRRRAKGKAKKAVKR